MTTIQIPSSETHKYVRPSSGEIFGSLWHTKNVDLVSNPGKIKLSKRAYSAFDSADDTDFDVPVAFKRTNADGTDRWWALTQANTTSTSDGLLWKSTNTNPSTGWAQDAIASTPTDAVDNMVIFGKVTTDQLYVARDTDLSELQNGTWVADWWTNASHLNQAALTATNTHYIYPFLNLMLVPDGRNLHTIDDSEVVTTNRIQLPNEYQILWIHDDGIRAYIGARQIRGGMGLVFPWDGTSERYDEPIEVFSDATMAGVALNGVMHTINNKGQLLKFNGNAFEEVAHFPIFDTVYGWENALTIANTKLVNPNGMSIVNGRINILLSGAIEGTNQDSLENMPGGIWEYEPDIGLYNRYSLGQYTTSSNNAWGAHSVNYVGALTETNKLQGSFLAGADVWTGNATSITGIFVEQQSATNRGSFVTSQIYASDLSSFWSRLKLAFRDFENSTDRIVVKYRIKKNANFEDTPSNQRSAVTWSSTTVFTTTDTFFANVAVGDEVEVIRGDADGAIAHVLTISLSGSTYTVTLDEAIPNVANADTSDVRVQNWKKLGTISDTAINKKLYTIGKSAPWIQFKVELRGNNETPEIDKLLAEFETRGK